MQQMGMRGGIFFLFSFFRYLPYIAIGFLVIAIAIWIVFGVKKLRWAKILAIILTVFVVIFGTLSLASVFLGRNFRGGTMEFPQNGYQQEFQPPDFQDNNN